jgi:predicted ATPase
MGDAILAFFGAPIAHEDDPQRAVLAGIEIQQEFKTYAAEIRQEHGLDFGLRVGINTGLVVVGEIGSDLRMEYTAIGDAINLAARMEQTAAVGTLQISEDTYKLVAPFFDIEALGEVEVKGKSTPVKTYQVTGVKLNPGHLRGLEGLSSPLVGREVPMALLNERLNQLQHGAGSVVSVIGEAGLGKSTLISELKKVACEPQPVWLRGDALSYTRSISYYIWKQVVRQSIAAQESDLPAEVRHKLGTVCECSRVPRDAVPFLEAMLGVESEESLQAVALVQGEALVQRIVEATRAALCGLAADHPLVIIFDDLHWADEASLSLMEPIADLAKTQPILFVCLARPELNTPGWEALNKIQQALDKAYFPVVLEPLKVEQTEALVENLLGMQNLPVNIRRLILERSDGNPFYIEEIIRSLIETKQIVWENGAWRAVGLEPGISLPNTLRGLLGARIDRLPDAARNTLQIAAVIGRTFDFRVLKRLISSNGGLEGQIQDLSEAHLIEPLDGGYAFRHVLIQEASYESILIKNRTQIHKRIGETLEALHADRLEEFAPLIAHHYYHAQDERSLKYDILAGEKARRLYANTEASTHFSRALETAKKLGDQPEIMLQLYTQLGAVLELSGRYEQALSVYNEMQAFGQGQADPSIEMKALMAKATIYSIFNQIHDPALSEQMLVEALEISRVIDDRAAQTKLNWNLMVTYLFSKRLDKALQHGEVALALARQADDREQLAFVLNDLCRLYTNRGEFEKAHASTREARELWRSLENQVMLADSLGSEAEVYLNAGEYDLSLECCQQALDICVRINNLWGQSYDRMLMAFALFENGQLGRGIKMAEASIELGDEAGLIATSITLRSELAWVYAYCGAVEKGDNLVEQATQISDDKQPGWRSYPQAASVRMHLFADEIERAEEITGKELLQPISIPYARFTILIALANIQLAAARKEYRKALSLVNELLAEVTPLTRVDVPEALRWKGKALLGLGRIEEALHCLTEACSRAEGTKSYLYLWAILADLAELQAGLDRLPEAKRNQEKARKIIGGIADSLREVGLADQFLGQARVRKLFGGLPDL